ncbi:MAG: asparaginase [Chloroflexi bacterium]|nr:asparaginase [Chloroflexota bacterium]
MRRGSIVESLHHGALAVADVAGNLVASVGDPDLVTFLRSTAKPFQALPVIESGAAARYAVTPQELALICASHAGTDVHTRTAAGLLLRLGLSENDLLCGAHRPMDSESALRLDRAGESPTSIHNNCSGKHSGMLAHAAHLREGGWDGAMPYIDPAHPIQQANLAAVADMAGIDPAAIVVGVDGCSAPTFALPLRCAARAFARLMDPAGLSPARTEACREIVSAMTSHPEMVSGRGRLDTELIRLGAGRLIAKGGAEGYEGVGVAPGALGPGSPALGVALKILDGDPMSRALKAVTIEVLRQLGAIDEAAVAALADHAAGPIRNWRGVVVGEAKVCFELER